MAPSTGQMSSPIIEDVLQLPPDDEPVEKHAQRAERRHVSDQVAYLSPAFRQGAEEMLMMPDSTGADPLLVDQAMRRVHLHDLG